MPDFSADLLDLPAARAAAKIALGYIDDAATAAARLSDTADQEALHDFRVAIRRLRVTLRGYPRVLEELSKKQRRRLRKLARHSNPARDAEVQIAWFRDRSARFTPGQREALDKVRSRLRARRRRELASTQQKLQRWFGKLERKLRRRLDAVEGTTHEPSFRAVAATTLARQASELSARLRDASRGAEPADLHATRIAAKRLRYLLEPVASGVADANVVVEQLRTLQGLLGELTDGHALEVALHEKEEEGDATSAALRLLHGELEGVFAKLRQDWSQAGSSLEQQVGAIARQLRPAAQAPPSMRRRTRRRQRSAAV